MPETTAFTLITLYHYLLLATIEADDFAINNKNKKNSIKFLIPLGWEFSTSWHTYCPNSFCTDWFSPDSKTATTIKQLSVYFPAHSGSLNIGPYKAHFFQVQLHPISHAMYKSLKLSHSWNTRPCSNHSGRTWMREHFWSLGWDVISLCGHKYLMATQELHTFLFVGRERNGCFEETLGIKCSSSNLKCLPLYIPQGSIYYSRYALPCTTNNCSHSEIRGHFSSAFP